MKVCINAKFIDGPFGGGIKFAIDLKGFLIKNGNIVVNTLEHPDIDAIVNVSFFPCIYSASSFSYLEAYQYKIKKKDTLIITRINNTPSHDISPEELENFVKSFQYSDVIVFISKWVQKEYANFMSKDILERVKIIHNGGDEEFYSDRDVPRVLDKKVSLVTHHWSNHVQKGHNVYKIIDQMLNDKRFSEKFQFTYIGLIPDSYKYKNIKILPPLNGKSLASEIRTHDIYITAAQDEPAGMHHIEGAMSGLPIMYIKSGALPEYCSKFGVEFDESNFEERLNYLVKNYDIFLKKLHSYPFINSIQLPKYLELIVDSDPGVINTSKYIILLRSYFYKVKYCFFYKIKNKTQSKWKKLFFANR
jgi:hypothetical protein